MLFALVPVWAVAGCYAAGQSASRGAFDEAKAWWREEGKAVATEASTAAVDAASATFQKQVDEARERLQAEWQARVAELDRKVGEGKATPIEIALWVLLGGLGAGGTKTVLERVLIGKRNGASNGA